MTNLFAFNRYTIMYLAFINSKQLLGRKKLRKSDPRYVYYEAHHGLPAAVYPEYADFKIHTWNRVLLTPREHFFAHMLLCRSFENVSDRQKMNKAIRLMNLPSSIKTSRIYALEKQRINREGRSDEERRRISEGLRGNTNGSGNRGKPRSAAAKINISNGLIGNKYALGKKMSPERSAAQSKLLAGNTRACTRPAFKLISPEGVVLEGRNRSQFCRDHGLSLTRICALLNGAIETYKDWKVAP